MKVTRKENGNINIELESQREVTALWAVASNISGAMDTPRSIFSDNTPNSPGLAQKLAEHVPSSDIALKRYGVISHNPPPDPQDTLARAFSVLLAGDMGFMAMPSPPAQHDHTTEAETWSA